MELAVSTFGVMLVFVPEEYVSQSSSEEYKAGAIVLHDGLEIALLEPSGELLLNDGPRFGYGHIKEAFGCFTIYNEIIRTYHFAIEETVSNLKIYFVHARRKLYNTLNGYLAHLCDSFVVARALFCKAVGFKKMCKFTIPRSKKDIKNILAMSHFVWQLKLKRTADTVQEHDDYEMQRMIDNDFGESIFKVINRHGNQEASQRCQIWHSFAN
ncbi:hypothetical protein RMATCC62417_07176 [Rhizopus microsporus]|nr:hypothetical protein RMATCC62417_07176 [Rhizopus microsporus]